jgi:hypothetical protein
MSSDIPESDWRRFKEVRSRLLERFCGQILRKVAASSQSAEGNAHDWYLKVFELINERNRQMSHAFDDFRRSTAVMQLGIMRRMKLLTDEDIVGFSEQTRTRIEGIESAFQ